MSPVTFFFLGGIALRVLSIRVRPHPGRVPDEGIPHNDNGYRCAAKNRAGQTSCGSLPDLVGSVRSGRTQFFWIWSNDSSTGVSRPKISTRPLTFFESALI